MSDFDKVREALTMLRAVACGYQRATETAHAELLNDAEAALERLEKMGSAPAKSATPEELGLSPEDVSALGKVRLPHDLIFEGYAEAKKQAAKLCRLLASAMEARAKDASPGAVTISCFFESTAKTHLLDAVMIDKMEPEGEG